MGYFVIVAHHDKVTFFRAGYQTGILPEAFCSGILEQQRCTIIAARIFVAPDDESRTVHCDSARKGILTAPFIHCAQFSIFLGILDCRGSYFNARRDYFIGNENAARTGYEAESYAHRSS